MASYDAGSLTNKTKKTEKVYKDLNLDFQQNSATKDIQKIENVESVKRSVRNLINLNYYEKPFHPEIGSNLRGLLFEPADAITKIAIKENVKKVLRDYEPRVKVLSIGLNDLSDQNAYRLTVKFLIKENDTDDTVEILLRRLR